MVAQIHNINNVVNINKGKVVSSKKCIETVIANEVSILKD